jgi:hypothetical protein
LRVTRSIALRHHARSAGVELVFDAVNALVSQIKIGFPRELFGSLRILLGAHPQGVFAPVLPEFLQNR